VKGYDSNFHNHALNYYYGSYGNLREVVRKVSIGEEF